MCNKKGDKFVLIIRGETKKRKFFVPRVNRGFFITTFRTFFDAGHTLQ